MGSIYRLVKHPLKFRLFLLKNLPAAFFSGLKVEVAGPEQVIVSVPYNHRTRNPFRSTYFACLSMAAEMATGVHCMEALQHSGQKVSLLVVAVEGKFYKKATAKTYFNCSQGAEISQAVTQAVSTGEAISIKALARGTNAAGDLIAEFWITWSFKTRTPKP